MQIDFHYGATYVIACVAGFDEREAGVIAYSAQYVDDSTTSGFLRFDNGMRFHRHATSHPATNLVNVDNDEAALSWLPFHFLPGNALMDTPAPAQAEGYWPRLVCRPDSPVARAMVADAIAARDRPHALHRLGIAAHVFIDTFAHQGFVGQLTERNQVHEIQDVAGARLDRLVVPPIGHGQANIYPDQPWLKWQYLDHENARVVRDNPADYLRAADRLCQEFRRYRAGDPGAAVPGLGDAASAAVQALIREQTSMRGETRLEAWRAAAADGRFGARWHMPEYVGKGPGSWKHAALGDGYLGWLARAQAQLEATPQHQRSLLQRVGAGVLDGIHRLEALTDLEPPEFAFDARFLTSDYKYFHDAAEDQRHAVFGTILPAFGIHAA